MEIAPESAHTACNLIMDPMRFTAEFEWVISCENRVDHPLTQEPNSQPAELKHPSYLYYALYSVENGHKASLDRIGSRGMAGPYILISENCPKNLE